LSRLIASCESTVCASCAVCAQDELESLHRLVASARRKRPRRRGLPARPGARARLPSCSPGPLPGLPPAPLSLLRLWLRPRLSMRSRRSCRGIAAACAPCASILCGSLVALATPGVASKTFDANSAPLPAASLAACVVCCRTLSAAACVAVAAPTVASSAFDANSAPLPAALLAACAVARRLSAATCVAPATSLVASRSPAKLPCCLLRPSSPRPSWRRRLRRRPPRTPALRLVPEIAHGSPSCQVVHAAGTTHHTPAR
jgi:hypothetical protein